MVAGVVVGSYLLGLQVMKQALNSSLKKQAVQELFKTLGIKGFKPQDLNTDKLDETGFARLVTLIREVKTGPGGDMMSQFAQLQQLGAMQQAFSGLATQGKPNVIAPPVGT